MRHTEIALRRPVTTLMVFVALAVIGTIASRLLPLERFPDIQFPGFFMQVPYPGSTPEEVERQITRPIEEVIATLPNVKQMRSTSRQDGSTIGVFLGWDSDAATTGIEARNKIDAIRDQLPDDLRRIFLFTGSTSDQPILVLRVSSDRDLSTAYDMLNRNLKRRIERIDGVSQTELQGVEPPEIRIQLDADRLAAHQLDINQLREQLQKANFSVSAGRITADGDRLSVRPIGEFTSVDDVEEIIVDGANLRLRDVASVTLQNGERTYGRHLDRRYAVGLNVFKTTSANLVEVHDRVMAEVERIGELPEMQGITLFTLDNAAENVRDSLHDLLKSGLIGALLAIGVLYLFLRQITTTLIVTLAVPFSLLITLGALYFFGLSLNILTMMGLMLAIGMLVDNGVVVTESIFRYRQMDPEHPRKATLAGVREVGLAVVAGTFTSAAVFLPIVFGEKVNIMIFLQHVAITIVVALLASLAISQTLIPMLAARIKPPEPTASGSLMDRFSNRYCRTLDWTLHNHWKTAGIVVLILVIGILPMVLQIVKVDPFPDEPDRRMFMPYHVEGEYSLERVEEAVERIEEYLYSNQERFEIMSVYSYWEPGRAESTILLRHEDELEKSPAVIQKMIEEGLPDIVIGKPSFQRNQQGGGGGAGPSGFSIQLSGDSTERLSEVSREVVRVLSSMDELMNVRSDVSSGAQEVRVSVDRDRAQQLGLDTQGIAQAVATAIRGENLREMRTDEGEVQVKLAYHDTDRQSIEDLEQLPLYTPEGERVLLSTVADLEIVHGMRAIQRFNRVTAVNVTADLAEDMTMEDVRPKVQGIMDQLELPPGYAWKFGQGFERNDETQMIMLVNILLGVVMIFLVMAALFESALYPLSIITSIVFSILGVFLFFAATGTPFTFMARIGIMILIGVVVNNGIVLVDHINNLRREGMPRDEAVIQGGRDRLRPILMTVATTILGLLPLAMGDTKVGGDGPPYYPMARAIIGGLAFSTITSLLLVPSFYVWFDGLSMWWAKTKRTVVSRLATPRALTAR